MKFLAPFVIGVLIINHYDKLLIAARIAIIYHIVSGAADRGTATG